MDDFRNSSGTDIGNLEMIQAQEIPLAQNNFETLRAYGTISENEILPPSHPVSSWCITKLKRTIFPPLIFKFIVFLLLPFSIWLSAFVIVGRDALPGGSIFVLVILGCGGKLLGYIFAMMSLPPMLGQLGLGLILGNVPYINFGKDLNPAWSSPIRQIALTVILTRGGLGLDIAILRKLKRTIFLFAIFPTTIEALTVALISHFLLYLPWAWSILLGFVLAPVSPAVVVPRLLELRSQGYGLEKGIPTFIIAAACLDNVFAISVFGVALNFVFATSNVTFSILQGPAQVFLGMAFGIIWGTFLGVFFNSTQSSETSVTLLRLVLTFGGGIISILGFSKLGYSGAGALGCLLSSFTAASIWRIRGIFSGSDPLIWAFYILWYIFEPLLFGIIGTQIDITGLDIYLVQMGVVTIIIGLSVRFLVAFVAVTKAGFTLKEKFFSALTWIPKATVQAAIGPIALDMVASHGNKEEDKIFGQRVLMLAVLSILLTSAIGEIGVTVTGPKFLTRTQAQKKDSAVFKTQP